MTKTTFMKIFKKYLMPISFFLSFIIILQGCTIYKKQNISLEEAVSLQGVVAKKKVKVVTIDNETQIYRYVTAINDKYYGVKKEQDGLTQIPLQQENLKTVKIQDKGATIIVGVLSFIGILVVTVGVIFAIEGGISIF